ncbi:hypothetical protein ONZ45_g11015 [Pleurotus djamor]|nr:hypothetical protein ONZ45_g11015 [Pleurotus djamor]
MYDAWTHEWRMKSKTGASPVLAYPDGLPQHTATASHNGPGSTRSVSQVSRSPRTPGAQPEPSLTQASENASLVLWEVRPCLHLQQAPKERLTRGAKFNWLRVPNRIKVTYVIYSTADLCLTAQWFLSVPNVPNVSNINVDNQPPPPSVAAPADTSPSIPHPLDAHIRFFKALREASDRHLKALMEHKAEQERHQAKENEMKEQIRALEQKLKESQDSQESLRSRFRAIVQDLQEEVQRESYPVKDEADNPKKRKMEDEEELVYPSQRVRQSN